jgi:hypothetical protein
MATQTPAAAGPVTDKNPKGLRRHLRKLGRRKRAQKLKTDKEFAKTFFAARSKRSTDKKSAFRKKKARKK